MNNIEVIVTLELSNINDGNWKSWAKLISNICNTRKYFFVNREPFLRLTFIYFIINFTLIGPNLFFNL